MDKPMDKPTHDPLMHDPLQITPDFLLPPDADARRISLLGMSGSGKTSGGKVLVERLAAAARRVCVIDPAGVWWGLRTGADGTSPGLPFVVFGGRHADVPLEASAGAAVADLVMREGVPVVLDLSGFEDDGDVCRVAADFIRRLRFLQHPGVEPLLLVVDEADLVAPQNARKEALDSQRQLIGAARRSRSDGLGLLTITQRPAALHKDVLGQAEAVFLFRFAGFNDLDAVRDWLGSYLSPAERDQAVRALPSLAEGECFLSSPSWMHTFMRLRFPLPATFDSSATPRAGQRRAVTGSAPIDVSALAERFAAAIERERQEDPEILRRRIAGLETKLRDMERIQLQVRTVEVERVVEVPILTDAMLERAREVADALISSGKDVMAMGHEMIQRVRLAAPDPAKAVPGPATTAPETNEAAGDAPPDVRAVPSPAADPAPPAHGGLTAAQQRLLDTLARFLALGLSGLDKRNLAVFAGRGPRSSSLDADLRALKAHGLLDGTDGTAYRLTRQGRGRTSPRLAPPTLRELHEAWRRALADTPRRYAMLLALTEAPGHALAYNALAERSGQSATSSSYDAHLRWLRDLGLVSYTGKGDVRATALLFPEGLS